jgi:hypothetical protein
MTARPTLPPLVERFFTERLMRQRNASPHCRRRVNPRQIGRLNFPQVTHFPGLQRIDS